jgi:hypothetical protein
MTDATLREVLDRYERDIQSALVRARVRKDLKHLLTMIPQMRSMIDAYQPLKVYLTPCWEAIEGITPATFDALEFEEALSEYGAKREKVMRWLGFMQGVLCATGIYTIDEMRAHNKPPTEAFEPR